MSSNTDSEVSFLKKLSKHSQVPGLSSPAAKGGVFYTWHPEADTDNNGKVYYTAHHDFQVAKSITTAIRLSRASEIYRGYLKHGATVLWSDNGSGRLTTRFSLPVESILVKKQ